MKTFFPLFPNDLQIVVQKHNLNYLVKLLDKKTKIVFKIPQHALYKSSIGFKNNSILMQMEKVASKF